MKAMLFSPGKLTIAYREKKRMRYIPPISLYIFISVVFFLAASFTNHDIIRTVPASEIVGDTTVKVAIAKGKTPVTTKEKIGRLMISYGQSIGEKGEAFRSPTSETKELEEHFMHLLPKVFFFMIPVMALILSLLFITRKDNYFVDHAIFSLHFQTLFFTLTLISLPASGSVYIGITIFTALCSFVYFVMALKKVYNTGWIKSVVFTAITSFLYSIVLIAAIVFTTILFV